MANFGGPRVSTSLSPVGGGLGGSPLRAPSRSFRISQPTHSDAGKAIIDLSAPDLGLGESLGNLGDLAGGLAGGVLGAVGSIGIPGGPNIGDIPEAAGDALGAVGSLRLPGVDEGDRLPTNPTLGGTLGGGGVANVGAVPGAIIDVLGLPGRAIERTAAGRRIEAAQKGETEILSKLVEWAAAAPLMLTGTAALFGTGPADMVAKAQGDDLPPDLMDAVTNGTMTVDQAADELVDRAAGFSSNAGVNLVGEVLFDPMNLIGGAVGKGGKLLQEAGTAVNVGADVSDAERIIGTTYNAATHALTAAQRATVERFVGPATSGVFHALGTRPSNRITSGLRGISPEYAQRFSEALGIGAAQLPRAVIGRQMGDEASDLFRSSDTLASRGEVAEAIEARLGARRAIDPARVERDAEELLLRVAPDFAGHTPEAIRAATVTKLARIIGGSEEDAARVLGDRVDLATARTVHLAYYGRAGDDLLAAQSAVGKSDTIDVDRLTLIAEDTLTTERAAELLAGGPEDVRAAVARFSILANRFAGTAYDEAKVRAFVSKLAEADALPEAVRQPKSGANALPDALGEWRKAYAPSYDLGFAPKDGWKVILDDDGEVIASDPFVHFVSDRTRLSQRNPLGRFMDSLFRGVSQTRIILDSRARMVAVTRDLGLSPNEARAIHKRVLEEARDEGVAPRGLSMFGSKSSRVGGHTVRLNRFDEAFRAVLGDDRFVELIQRADPTVLMMRALEGDLARVGLTQKFTGRLKAVPLTAGGSNVAAAISEGVYPMVRFRLNPLFQIQERAESPFLNLLRGVERRAIAPEVGEVYARLAELPEFRYISEAGYFLNLAGGEAFRRSVGSGPLAAVVNRFPDVAGAKAEARLAQVMSEHPEAFRGAVEAVNPRLWATMTEAYGTTDAARIADRFVTERLNLASDAKSAMAEFDKLAGLDGIEGQTVWQAFRESFRQTSAAAFRTHYFDTERGWLERTLNHPFLGLYPLSYYAKVTREFARFLLVRPFGIRAPLVGLEALYRVQHATVAAMADPEFAGFVEDHPDALFLVQSLIPAFPTEIPVNAPGWARTIAEQGASGKPVTGETVQQAVMRSADYAIGVVRGPRTILEGGLDAGSAMGDLMHNLEASKGDLLDNLDRAAAAYDSMYGVSP